MGRRPIENKKLPADYPQIAFRLSKESKERVMSLIEDIQDQRNGRRKEGEPFVNKNDIFLEALEKGLKLMKK